MGTVELRKKWVRSIVNVDDRFLRMVDALYNSYTEDIDYDISEEHKKILDQRLEDHKTNPTLGRDWDEVKTELSAKYGI